jgi:hypothetical protein
LALGGAVVVEGDFGGALTARDECLAGGGIEVDECVAVADSLEWRVLRRREFAVVLAARVAAAAAAAATEEEAAAGG